MADLPASFGRSRTLPRRPTDEAQWSESQHEGSRLTHGKGDRPLPSWPRPGHRARQGLEAAALLSGLIVLGYITFVTSGENITPVLLYSLVPFLLWSALRFGTIGTTT